MCKNAQTTCPYLKYVYILQAKAGLIRLSYPCVFNMRTLRVYIQMYEKIKCAKNCNQARIESILYDSWDTLLLLLISKFRQDTFTERWDWDRMQGMQVSAKRTAAAKKNKILTRDENCSC